MNRVIVGWEEGYSQQFSVYRLKPEHLLQILHIFRRNVWQEAREKPLNRHFVSAGLREQGAEMAQVQRIARVCPPRRHCRAVAADVRESSAENAKRNAKNLTQSRKVAKTQREIQLNRRDAEGAEIHRVSLQGFAQRFS